MTEPAAEPGLGLGEQRQRLATDLGSPGIDYSLSPRHETFAQALVVFAGKPLLKPLGGVMEHVPGAALQLLAGQALTNGAFDCLVAICHQGYIRPAAHAKSIHRRLPGLAPTVKAQD